MASASPTGSQATLNSDNAHRHGEFKNEKGQAGNRFENELDSGKVQIPAGARVNAAGVPTYLGLTGAPLIWAVTVAASFGFGLFGYDQGVMSGIISAPQFVRDFPDVDAAIQGDSQAATMQAFYVAIYEVGCLLGAIGALAYGDRLGRRRMMYIASAIMVVGVVIQCLAIPPNGQAVQFIVGRTITGVGNGMNTATIPTWHAETAKSHNRGLLVCIEAGMISTGTAISYWVNYGCAQVDSSFSWRFPIGLQLVFVFGLVGLIWYLPESPRWLVSHGDLAEAQRVVAALEPAPFHDPVVVSSTKVILDSLEGAPVRRKKDLLTNGPTQHLRRVLLGASSQIMQQIGGCNAVIYFAPVIFQERLGLNRNLSLILGGVNVTVYALAAFIAFVTIEKVGRRSLFLIGSGGQALAMFIVMAGIIPNTESSLKASVFGMFLFLIFFGFTWLQLPWLYPAEINPLATRTNANAVSTICNWLFNFAIVMATPPLLDSINWGTFLLFGALNLCFIPIIFIWYPETAGRTLEEIDVIFAIGYVEKKWYPRVAKEMPKLSSSDIETEYARLGLGRVPMHNEA